MPIKCDAMPGHRKSGWSHILKIPWTPGDVENLLAIVALEVMMVSQIRQFIASRRPGDFNNFKDAALNQTFQISVYGRYPNSRQARRGHLPDFIRR